MVEQSRGLLYMYVVLLLQCTLTCIVHKICWITWLLQPITSETVFKNDPGLTDPGLQRFFWTQYHKSKLKHVPAFFWLNTNHESTLILYSNYNFIYSKGPPTHVCSQIPIWYLVRLTKWLWADSLLSKSKDFCKVGLSYYQDPDDTPRNPTLMIFKYCSLWANSAVTLFLKEFLPLWLWYYFVFFFSYPTFQSFAFAFLNQYYVKINMFARAWPRCHRYYKYKTAFCKVRIPWWSDKVALRSIHEPHLGNGQNTLFLYDWWLIRNDLHPKLTLWP